MQDATHQPKDFMSVYKGTSQATLPGEIQTSGTFQSTLAKISRELIMLIALSDNHVLIWLIDRLMIVGPQSGPTTLPEGEYYTVNIIANRGHDPFVKWVRCYSLYVIYC